VDSVACPLFILVRLPTHIPSFNYFLFVQVKALQEENIVAMAAGEHFSLALNLVGNLIWSWGRSDYGQLGLFGTRQDTGACEMTPQMVPFPDGGESKIPLRFSQIDAGDRHAFAVSDEGAVYTWGFAETGALGFEMPDDTDCYRPQKLDVLWAKRKKNANAANSLVKCVSGGGQHSLMVIERYA
jgi:regulator of chromosome condensation